MSQVRVVRGAVAVALALAAGLLAPAPAYAVGGNCSSALEKEERSWQPDVYRVRARCSSLQADSKAQGVLDRNVSQDGYTQWFTRIDFNYYSGWYVGPISGTYVKISHL